MNIFLPLMKRFVLTSLAMGLGILMGVNPADAGNKVRVWPGYKLVGLMVSNEPWKGGLRTLADLKGRRVGVTQIGSTFHYMLGNILEEKGLSLGDVKITPLGGVKNMLDAVASSRIDTAFMVQPFCTLMEAKKLGYIMSITIHVDVLADKTVVLKHAIGERPTGTL